MLTKIKKSLFFALLLASFYSFGQKDGYNIKIKLDNYNFDTLYLGNYYGSSQYIKDTAIINSKKMFVFSGKEALLGGVYLVITQDKKYFEVIIDKEQNFTIECQYDDFYKNIKIKGSPDNEIYCQFVNYNRVKYELYSPFQKKMEAMKDNKDTVEWCKKQLEVINNEIGDYKKKFMSENPNHLMTKVFKASKEIDVPEAPKKADGSIDSLFSYRYYKQHYWDNVDFTDDRILRTPVYHNKLDYYFKNLIIPSNDSIKVACDDIIEKTRPSKELFKYTVWYLTNRYEKSSIMGQDEVFVYLVEKYYMSNQAFWVTPTILETISKRAMQLKPILIGKVAPELIMPDTSGAFVSMRSSRGRFTFLVFWDTDCGHCKVEMPKIKKFYDENKAKYGLEVFSIDTDSDLERWKKYIIENKHEWISVTGTKTNLDYHKVYDIISTPVLFILDKDFKIIAKHISIEDAKGFLDNYLEREKLQKK
ncbi:MAG: thioredoxin-like domain-containing protein [Bacteroidales bacterium]